MWTATAMATPPLPLTAAEATILRQITLTDVLTFKALDVARSLRPSLPPSLPVPPYILHRGNPYQDSCKRNFRPATGKRRRSPHTMYKVRLSKGVDSGVIKLTTRRPALSYVLNLDSVLSTREMTRMQLHQIISQPRVIAVHRKLTTTSISTFLVRYPDLLFFCVKNSRLLFIAFPFRFQASSKQGEIWLLCPVLCYGKQPLPAPAPISSLFTCGEANRDAFLFFFFSSSFLEISLYVCNDI